MMEVIDECPDMDGDHAVYEIRFSTGHFYIGITSDLKRRMERHYASCRNGMLLREMLASGRPRTVAVVARYSRREDAEDHEADLISEADDEWSLNGLQMHRRGVGSNRRPARKRNYPRIADHRPYRCALCREWKQARDFHSDCCRSSGLNSRCKECCAYLDSRVRVLRRRGVPEHELYLAAKATRQKGATNAKD